MNDKKWYSGRYDRAFKEVMLYEKNRDILIMLLEKILNVTIETLEVINVEKLVSNVHIKDKRLDLNLKTNIGKINVEVNSINKKYIHQRNMAYLCDTYSHDTLVGEEYNGDIRYIQINLSYGLSKDKEPIRLYKLMTEDKEVYVDNFHIYDVNMDYYIGLWYNKDTEKMKDNLVLVMLGLGKEELVKLSKYNKVVSRYMKELDRVNENPEFREYMSYEEDQRKIRNTLISEAKQLGFEQGIEKGCSDEKYSIAKKLLVSGMKVEEIARITELPKEIINKLRDTE